MRRYTKISLTFAIVGIALISTVSFVRAQYDQQTTTRESGTITERLDRAVEHQVSLREKIRTNPGLSHTTKEQLLAGMDAHMRRLQEIRSQSSRAQSETDASAIRTHAREEWERYQVDHLQYRGTYLAGRIQDILDRLENTAAKVKVRINQNETLQTTDLTSINEALASFDTAHANAQATLDDAIEVFGTINNDMTQAEAQDTFQTGMQLLRDARGQLREAHMHVHTAITQAYTLLRSHTDATQN